MARLPTTPATLFIMGPIMVGFCGFWIAGARNQRLGGLAADQDLKRHPSFTNATVTDVVRRKNGYRIDYNFEVKGGQVFAGSVKTAEARQMGAVIPVVYASDNPSTSTIPGVRRGSDFQYEWIGLLMGMAVLGGFCYMGRRQLGWDAARLAGYRRFAWPRLGRLLSAELVSLRMSMLSKWGSKLGYRLLIITSARAGYSFLSMATV